MALSAPVSSQCYTWRSLSALGLFLDWYLNSLIEHWRLRVYLKLEVWSATAATCPVHRRQQISSSVKSHLLMSREVGASSPISSQVLYSYHGSYRRTKTGICWNLSVDEVSPEEVEIAFTFHPSRAVRLDTAGTLNLLLQDPRKTQAFPVSSCWQRWVPASRIQGLLVSLMNAYICPLRVLSLCLVPNARQRIVESLQLERPLRSPSQLINPLPP